MSTDNGMVSLVNFLGDKKIKFQVVHNSIDGQVSLLKNGSTKFTMVTESSNLSPSDLITGKPKRIGLLMWVDAADIDAWRASNSEESR